MKCPLCGTRVVYEGLNSIECEGAARPEGIRFFTDRPRFENVPAQPACSNYRAPAEPKPPRGGLDWARGEARRGFKMEVYTSSGIWVPRNPFLEADPHSSWRHYRIGQ